MSEANALQRTEGIPVIISKFSIVLSAGLIFLPGNIFLSLEIVNFGFIRKVLEGFLGTFGVNSSTLLIKNC